MTVGKPALMDHAVAGINAPWGAVLPDRDSGAALTRVRGGPTLTAVPIWERNS